MCSSFKCLANLVVVRDLANMWQLKGLVVVSALQMCGVCRCLVNCADCKGLTNVWHL